MAVARLRRALEPLDTQDGSRLRTVSGGYLLLIARGELDVDVFEDRVRDGRRALTDGDAARASDLLGEALGLWRGPPLAEVTFEDFAQADIRGSRSSVWRRSRRGSMRICCSGVAASWWQSSRR